MPHQVHKYPSVTTVLGIVQKEELVKWQIKHSTTKLNLLWSALGDLKVSVDLSELKPELKKLRIDPNQFFLNGDEIARESREIGDDFHERIETFIKTGTFDTRGTTGSMSQTAISWLSSEKIEGVEQETQLVSERFHYQGTPDLIGKKEGKLVIVDWKTSSRMDYKWYPVQIAAYAKVYEEIHGEKIDHGYIVRVGKIKGKQKPKLDVLKVNNLDEYFPVFLKTLDIYKYQHSYGKYGAKAC